MSVMRRKNTNREATEGEDQEKGAEIFLNKVPDICDYIDAELDQAERLAQDAERKVREIVPLTPNSTRIERRASPRTYTTYRLARVASEIDEGFARCRNISDEGARLLISMSLRTGDRVSIAFAAPGEIRGRVIWVMDDECGIMFDHPIDSAALLRSVSSEGRRPVPTLRLRGEVPATIRFEGHSQASAASDISLREMNLTHDGKFTPGLHVTVLLNDGCERGAVVWGADSRRIAVSLLEPFDIPELGSLQRLQHRAADIQD